MPGQHSIAPPAPQRGVDRHDGGPVTFDGVDDLLVVADGAQLAQLPGGVEHGQPGRIARSATQVDAKCDGLALAGRDASLCYTHCEPIYAAARGLDGVVVEG